MNAISRLALRLSLAPAAFALSACDGGDGYPDDYPPPCDSGVAEGVVDSGEYLELDPGRGVGATVEYTGGGAWRFAVTCDSYESGYGCDWSLLVSPIDGTIDSFAPERLETDDLIERYPSTAGSTDEDSVLLLSYTDYDIDAFTLLGTPGAGLRVDAALGPYCGGPFLFWSENGETLNSNTNPTDLFPSEP